MNHLPINTLRDLALVAVLVADIAWEGTRKTLKRLRPHIQPPSDLLIRSSKGALYSGLLLVDNNEVIAGIVVRTGHAPNVIPETTSSLRSSSLTNSWSSPRSPLVTPPSSSFRGRDDDYDDCRLPGWAEDPREDSEEDRWKR